MKLQKKKGFTLIELMIVIAIIAIIAAIAIPNLIEARKHGNEAAAIGALKTLSTAQTLFREGDKDQDGELQYGTLTELANANLIDTVLGSGSKQGYVFGCGPATDTGAADEHTFLWFATANPAAVGTTGDRYFATNHAGVIYYTGTGPIAVNADNTNLPQSNALPVGK